MLGVIFLASFSCACSSRSLGVGSGTTGTSSAGAVPTGGGNISTPTPTPGSTGSGAWNAGGQATGVTVDPAAVSLTGNPGGTFTSRILDKTDPNTTWSSLSALTDRPVNIPLPDNRGQDPAGFLAGKFNMGTGGLENQGLYHLTALGTGGAVADTSGLGRNGVCAGGCGVSTNRGFFGQPTLTFDGANNTQLKFGQNGATSPSFGGNGALSISAWFSTSRTKGTLFAQRDGDGVTGQVVLALGRDCPNGPDGVAGQIHFCIWAGDNGNQHASVQTTNAQVTDGQWHQVVATRDAGGMMSIYIDGVLSISNQQSAVSASSGLKVCVAGDCRDNGGNGFLGQIQELAVFNSALNASAVADMHVRARPGVGFQVRAGNDPTFPGAQFVGPDGTGDTFFLPNSGPSGSAPTALTVNNAAVTGRYFQFRATMAPLPQAAPLGSQILPKLLGFSLTPNPF